MANGRRVGRVTVKRPTFWTGAQSTQTVVIATPQSVQAVVTEAALENVPNPTLVRTRGTVRVVQGATIDSGAGIVGIGLAVLGAKQVTVGTTAIPLPFTNSDDDRWFWYGGVGLRNSVGGITDVANGHLFEVDSKAMRKVGSNQVVALVVELTDVNNVVSVTVDVALRFLFKR